MENIEKIASENKLLNASILVAISGILYGFLGFLGTKVLQANLSINAMLFWRFFIAGSWMFLFSWRKQSLPAIIQINKRTLISIVLLGATGYAGSSGFYFLASHYTGTGLAMVIFFSYPILIALFSWLGQRRPLKFSLAFALITMMLGLFMLRDVGAHSINITGILFGMLAAFSYAFYIVASKHISSTVLDSNVSTILVCLGSAAVFLGLAIFSHNFGIPHSLKGWIYLLGLGILATALPIQLMLDGLKHISSVRASIISVLEPLVTLLVGVFLLKESVSQLQILGAVIILGGALMALKQQEI